MDFKKKLKTNMLVLTTIIMVLAQGLMVSANDADCAIGAHGPYRLYSKTLRYRQKTGEHVITLSNGTQAVCYIYDEYYDVIYYCDNCHSQFSGGTSVTRNVHSLGR